jgi:hypothetical protein
MHARWIAGGFLGLTCTGLPAQEIALTPPLPPAIQEIEVIYTGQCRPRVRSAINTILTTVPNVSLAGILIHDLDAFLALPG